MSASEKKIESTKLETPYVQRSLNDVKVNQSGSKNNAADSSNNREAPERSDAEDQWAQFSAIRRKGIAEAKEKFEAEVNEKLAALPDTERASIGAREKIENELHRRHLLEYFFKNR